MELSYGDARETRGIRSISAPKHGFWLHNRVGEVTILRSFGPESGIERRFCDESPGVIVYSPLGRLAWLRHTGWWFATSLPHLYHTPVWCSERQPTECVRTGAYHHYHSGCPTTHQHVGTVPYSPYLLYSLWNHSSLVMNGVDVAWEYIYRILMIGWMGKAFLSTSRGSFELL